MNVPSTPAITQLLIASSKDAELQLDAGGHSQWRADGRAILCIALPSS